jgi:hypothetical protein
MPYRTTCPFCKRLLDVPDGCEDAPLVCPGCQKEVVHPARQASGIQVAPVAVTGEKPTLPTSAPVPLPPTPADENECTGCGELLSRDWFACPFCGRPRRGPSPLADGPRRPADNGPDPATILLAIVGAFGLLALLIVLFGAGLPPVETGVSLFLVIIVGLVSAAAASLPSQRSPSPPSAGRIFVRVLAVYGGFMAIGMGCWVLVFSVCLAAMNPRYWWY